MKKKKYNRLSEVLREKEWTQTQLAEKLGVAPQSIQKVCSNVRQMSMQRLNEVAKILKVTVCDLLVNEDYREESEAQSDK